MTFLRKRLSAQSSNIMELLYSTLYHAFWMLLGAGLYRLVFGASLKRSASASIGYRRLLWLLLLLPAPVLAAGGTWQLKSDTLLVAAVVGWTLFLFMLAQKRKFLRRYRRLLRERHRLQQKVDALDQHIYKLELERTHIEYSITLHRLRAPDDREITST